MAERRTIKTDYLARVEGEGAMSVRLRGGEVEHVELRIFEPPRFFEALLRGRSFMEAPDITARICGICPVAYQMSSVQAMEDACGVEIPEPIHALAPLLYCGEWIESHALHVYMLHAPDFLGYPGAVELARDAPAAVERGLALKKTGNELMALVGGREIHPINVRVGGFYRAPTRRELRTHGRPARAGARGGARDSPLDGGLRVPRARGRLRARRSLGSPTRTRSSAGGWRPTRASTSRSSEYDEHFVEEHVERSNALHSRTREGASYLCGPLARFALGGDRLSPLVREAAREAGIEPPCRDAFRSIVVRSLELVYACDEALRLIEGYEEPDAPFVAVEPVAGIGYGATEAPRGLLYHRYRIDEDGTILDAKIVPPTSQNQLAIEDDLRASSGATRTCPTTSSARCASRRSATTTPASRALRTSST